MPRCNLKMQIIKIIKQNLFLFLFIDLIYFLSTFFLLIFSVYKLQEHIANVSALAPRLKEFQQLEMEKLDLTEVGNYLDVMNASSQKIITIIVLTLICIYLLYCFFQSMQFRLAFKSLKHKIKLEEIFHDYFKYFLKFSLLNIPFFVLFIFLLTKSYSTIFIVFLILLAYFILVLNILLNKFSIVQTLRKAFCVSIKSFKIFPIYLVVVASILIFKIIHPIAALAIFLIALNFCRLFFTEYVEKLK